MSAVKNVVDNEKSKILFVKPLNAILAAGDKIKQDNENEICLINSRIELLRMPDADIDEREENLSKAYKRLSKKTNSLGEDIESEIRNLVRKGKNELEDIVDASCQRMKEIIHNEWSRMKSSDSVEPKLNAEKQSLYTRKLKRATENLAEEGKRKINRCTEDFFADAEDLLMRYLPDFDSRAFVKSIRNRVQMDLADNDLFIYESSEQNYGLEDFVRAALDGASFGVFGLTNNILGHGKQVAQVEETINSFSRDFDAQPFLESAFQRKDAALEAVRTAFFTELLTPLQEQIQEIKAEKGSKEQQLQDAEARRKELNSQKEIIAKQLTSILELKPSIV